MHQNRSTPAQRHSSGAYSQGAQAQELSPPPQEEPLFLPSSQLSQADQEIIRAAGLGIEDMNMDEFNAMMDDDGEDVHDGRYRGADMDVDASGRGEGVEDIDDTQMAPTQGSGSSERVSGPYACLFI